MGVSESSVTPQQASLNHSLLIGASPLVNFSLD